MVLWLLLIPTQVGNLWETAIISPLPNLCKSTLLASFLLADLLVLRIMFFFCHFFAVNQGDSGSQHLSTAASILMSPMEFQAACSVGSATNTVSNRTSG